MVRPSKCITFSTAIGLGLTTVLSILLLASSVRMWTFPPTSYQWIQDRRATIQLIIQLLSNGLALIQVAILTSLINSATRIYWRHNSIATGTLRFWNALCVRGWNRSLPLHLMLPLLLYIVATAAPSAVWTGALTPVLTTMRRTATIHVPSYQNVTNIHEWPAEIGREGPILRSAKGVFAYSVGMQLQGGLLNTASSATPVDGSARVHKKLDASGFTYVGRSYGVGAAVGLVDDELMADKLLLGYTYEESGFDTTVTCVYNESSAFVLVADGHSWYQARGPLPNSGDAGPEDSSYVGHTADSIVAIGVGRNPEDPRHMLAIAAGSSYAHLNTTQCNVDFRPARFNVSVSAVGRNISVQVLTHEGVADLPVQSNLTYTLIRQFELISNTQTNLYVSLVGSSLNNSISDYLTARGAASPPLSEATLRGLENALVAMADDMLVAYASAQIMIQAEQDAVGATTNYAALRVGEDMYIYATFAVNIVVILLIAVEGVRTKGWRGLASLDYLDPGALLLASRSSQNLALQESGLPS
ncbi:hypothetical protein HD806DRAFT_518499 [Xylariaceae sp. AK1471]|nr:hypothetical protein HD806DRAFT_518499 [Xylariaceae sp. AK1471]